MRPQNMIEHKPYGRVILTLGVNYPRYFPIHMCPGVGYPRDIPLEVLTPVWLMCANAPVMPRKWTSLPDEGWCERA